MRKLGRGAIIVAALLLVVSVPGYIGAAVTSYSQARQLGNSVALSWLEWLPAAAALGLAGILVALREQFAELLFDDAEVGFAISPRGLLQLAIVVVGLGLAVDQALGTLSAAVSVGGQYATYRSMGDGAYGVALIAVGSAVSRVVGVVIGILLMRYAEPLARKLWIEPKPVVAKPGPGPAALGLSKCPSCGAPYDEADYVDMAVARCTTCHSPLRPAGE